MRLEVTGLMHRFGRGEAAVEIGRMEARPGTLTAITGPSGSGKSTLLYLLSGLLRPTQGRILWEATDLAALAETARDRWRRRHAGFVFQNFHLIGEMTPLANVTLAAHFGGFTDRAQRERAAALLERFGVPAERRPAASFSRGEQQRIAIARALLFDPPAIFADEPTASLDAGNAAGIAEALASLARAGKTVIAVSHDAELTGKADALLPLAHGRRADVAARAA